MVDKTQKQQEWTQVMDFATRRPGKEWRSELVLPMTSELSGANRPPLACLQSPKPAAFPSEADKAASLVLF